MADNSTQTGADTIATDDLTTLNGGASSGVKVQRVKIGQGLDGDFTDVSASNPLHVNVAQSTSTSAASTGSLTAAAASTITGTASTTGSVVLNVGAAGNASFHLLAAAFVGTVVFEQSFDPAGGAGTWGAVPVVPEDQTTAPVSSLAISTAAAYLRQFTQGMFGPALFRVRCSAFTSGSLAVYAKAGPGWVEANPSLAPSTANIGRAGPQTSATGTLSNVTPAASSATLLAANAARVGWKVTNDSNVDVLVNEAGATTSATAYSLRITAGGYYESSGTNMIYTGAVTCLGVASGTTTATAAASGACRVTEFV